MLVLLIVQEQHQGILLCIQTALAAVGATYAPGAGPLKGIVTFNSVEVPISSTAGQLWATEMAALYQSAQDAAQEHVRRSDSHCPAHSYQCCLMHIHHLLLMCMLHSI